MQNKTIPTALLLACCHLLSCRGTYPEPRYYNPVHAQYETAVTLGKGKLEIGGHFTSNVVFGNDPSGQYERHNNDFGRNIGFRFGYGFSKSVDVKLRYEHTTMPDVVSVDNSTYNVIRSRNYFFSVMPKISFKADKLSLMIPLNVYDYTSKQPAISNSVFREKYFSIAPHLVKTIAVKRDQVDFSASTNVEVGFSKDEYRSAQVLVFSGFNLNAGFSNNLTQWAVRPEVGYNFKFWDKKGVWNFGVALQLMLPHKTK